MLCKKALQKAFRRNIQKIGIRNTKSDGSVCKKNPVCRQCRIGTGESHQPTAAPKSGLLFWTLSYFKKSSKNMVKVW